MELIDVQLITPAKHKVSQRPAAEIAKARIRLVSSRCSRPSNARWASQDHQAKTIGGLVARIAQRLLALTIAIYATDGENLASRKPRRDGMSSRGRLSGWGRRRSAGRA